MLTQERFEELLAGALRGDYVLSDVFYCAIREDGLTKEQKVEFVKRTDPLIETNRHVPALRVFVNFIEKQSDPALLQRLDNIVAEGLARHKARRAASSANTGQADIRLASADIQADARALDVRGVLHQKSGEYARAAELFDAAIELGDAYAMFNLGYIHHKGQGGRVDYDSAIVFYERAIGLGNIYAMGFRASMHEEGVGGSRQLGAAVYLYQCASKGTHAFSKKRLDKLKMEAGLSENVPNADEILGLIKLSLDEKFWETKPQGVDEMRTYLKKAAELTPAEQLIGLQLIAHEHRSRFPIALTKEFTFYKCILSQEVAELKTFHAKQKTQLVATQKDELTQKERAIAQGSAFALYQRGMLEYRRENYIEAARFFQQALPFNEPGAIYMLAVLYAEGRGVSVNLTKAIQLHQRALKLKLNFSRKELAGLSCFFWNINACYEKEFISKAMVLAQGERQKSSIKMSKLPEHVIEKIFQYLGFLIDTEARQKVYGTFFDSEIKSTALNSYRQIKNAISHTQLKATLVHEVYGELPVELKTEIGKRLLLLKEAMPRDEEYITALEFILACAPGSGHHHCAEVLQSRYPGFYQASPEIVRALQQSATFSRAFLQRELPFEGSLIPFTEVKRDEVLFLIYKAVFNEAYWKRVSFSEKGQAGKLPESIIAMQQHFLASDQDQDAPEIKDKKLADLEKIACMHLPSYRPGFFMCEADMSRQLCRLIYRRDMYGLINFIEKQTLVLQETSSFDQMVRLGITIEDVKLSPKLDSQLPPSLEELKAKNDKIKLPVPWDNGLGL